MPPSGKLVNICPVFVSEDVRKTTEYYVDVLGFMYARHFDKADTFATLYRDEIEIVVVQKRKGQVKSNKRRYGNGYDAYIDTDTLEGVDMLFHKFQQKGVHIVRSPGITDCGSYEFVFQDIDGRNIGVGLIASDEKYFGDSNYREKDA